MSQESPKIPCHISDKVMSSPDILLDIEAIPGSICHDRETSKHSDGKHYCFLHLPFKEKDIAEFDGIINAYLKEVEEKVAETEKLPEDEREEPKEAISYDFRYVWFPKDRNFSRYKFLAYVDFSGAVFSGGASFKSSTFLDSADFISAAFSENADFDETVFSDYADFREAAFSGEASFRTTVFSGETFFSAATFSRHANLTRQPFLRSLVSAR